MKVSRTAIGGFDRAAHQHAVACPDGSRRVVSATYGVMIWALVTLRRPAQCPLCGVLLPVRAFGWSPQTHGAWRSCRVCTACWPR